MRIGVSSGVVGRIMVENQEIDSGKFTRECGQSHTTSPQAGCSGLLKGTTIMATKGWKALLEGAPWFRGKGKYPIDAYSEYIPPPRPYCKPYVKAEMPAGVDEYGWPVSAYEE